MENGALLEGGAVFYLIIAPQGGLSYGQANSSPWGAISAPFFFSVWCPTVRGSKVQGKARQGLAKDGSTIWLILPICGLSHDMGPFGPPRVILLELRIRDIEPDIDKLVNRPPFKNLYSMIIKQNILKLLILAVFGIKCR